MRARRPSPGDPADVGRSVVPLALIVLAAAVPIARPFVLAVLVGGVAVAIRRDAPVRWAWAAPIPVAVSLCWALLPVPPVSPSGADCASITSPIAVWRTAEAGIVIGTLAVLAWALRVRPSDVRRDLLLRMPARWVVRWSIVGFLVAGPLALLVGPILARPFFGEIAYDVTMVGAIAPALLFAVANGAMEELAYRGALLGWSARIIGVPAAVAGQAVVFGLAHSGDGRYRLAAGAHGGARPRWPDRRRHRRQDALAAAPDGRPHRARHPDLLRVRLWDAMSGTTSEFEAIEARLWSILEPYRGRLEAGSVYGLVTLKWVGTKQHDFFAGVRVAPKHVAFHLMPVYTDPHLLDDVVAGATQAPQRQDDIRLPCRRRRAIRRARAT